MSEPISQAIFFETVQQLRNDLQENHARLRMDMTMGFKALEAKMDVAATKLDAHAADDRVVADRVLVIEVERKNEAASTLKRNGIAALLGAAGLTAAWETLKRLVGW